LFWIYWYLRKFILLELKYLTMTCHIKRKGFLVFIFKAKNLMFNNFFRKIVARVIRIFWMDTEHLSSIARRIDVHPYDYHRFISIDEMFPFKFREKLEIVNFREVWWHFIGLWSVSPNDVRRKNRNNSFRDELLLLGVIIGNNTRK